MVETTSEWILERTGIYERHIAAPEEVTSDLAYQASIKALEAANLKATDIDFIILASVSGDQPMPSTACMLQAKLGCRNVLSFDINAACSGFVYALCTAEQFIKTGVYKRVLVVGVEILSRVVNYNDRNTCILFGDGAGAVILEQAPSDSVSRIDSFHLYSDGNLSNLLMLPAGGSKIPYTTDLISSGEHHMTMEGKEIFKHAVRTLTATSEEALQKNQLSINDIDWVIPHQANIRIIEAVAKYLKVPDAKLITNIRNTGNTSAASVPIAFDQAVRDGRIQRGHKVLSTVFGAGLTSGSVLFTY